MTVLKFRVEGQIITRIDSEPVVSDSKNFIHAEFEFDSEWDGVVKTALFKQGDTAAEVVLVDDECLVPDAVMATKRDLIVSVYGGDRITVNTSAIPIIKSGFIVAEPPEPPEPTQTYVKSFTDETGIQFIRNNDGLMEFWDGVEWKAVFLPTFSINEDMELIMEVNHG